MTSRVPVAELVADSLPRSAPGNGVLSSASIGSAGKLPGRGCPRFLHPVGASYALLRCPIPDPIGRSQRPSRAWCPGIDPLRTGAVSPACAIDRSEVQGRNHTLRPTDILKQEHHTIEALLERLEWAATEALRTRSLDLVLSGNLVEVLSVLLHRWHREKEERHFLPVIEARGVHKRVVQAALGSEEHESGHGEHLAVQAAWEAVAGGVPGAHLIFSRTVVVYGARLREHMKREEKIVFPLGEASLHEADRTSLLAKFRAVEAEDPAPGTWDEIQRLVGRDLLDRGDPATRRSNSVRLDRKGPVPAAGSIESVVGPPPPGGAEAERAAGLAEPSACSAGAG